MSGEVRLDAATLRHVLDAVSGYRLRVRAFKAGPRRAALGSACDDIADMLRKSIAAAESAPPTLSSWVAACEGTALGEPIWNGQRWDDCGMLTAHFASEHFRMVAFVVDGWPNVSAANLTMEPRNMEAERAKTRTFGTPAELRAALERLAGGEAPR